MSSSRSASCRRCSTPVPVALVGISGLPVYENRRPEIKSSLGLAKDQAPQFLGSSWLKTKDVAFVYRASVSKNIKEIIVVDSSQWGGRMGKEVHTKMNECIYSHSDATDSDI